MDLFGGAHAYLVRGEGSAWVTKKLREEGVRAGNPDVMIREYDTLAIDDVRAITVFAHLKPVGERKYIVIAAQSMTTEAQNGLLKIVEEGSGKSVFFFIVPLGVPVVPTLESRCVAVRAHNEGPTNNDGEDFLNMKLRERLALAEKFAKEHDREGARALVRSLLALSRKKTFSPRVLRDLIEADQYLALSGASPKSIIGHLALVV